MNAHERYIDDPPPFPGERELRRKLGDEAVTLVETQGWTWGWVKPEEGTFTRNPSIFGYCCYCNMKFEMAADQRYLAEAGDKFREFVEKQFLREVASQCSHIK